MTIKMINKEAAVAYRRVRSALDRGDLVRPPLCSRCGTAPAKASDGRSMIHAHHHVGYHQALDVQWVCAGCHRQLTPLPETMGAPSFGDKNGMRTMPESRLRGSKQASAKLTEAAVLDIKTRQCSTVVYAQKYGVAKWTVYDVLNGRSWGWLAAAPNPLAAPDGL